MESRLFTVYDSAAALFLEPFVAPTIEFALREFKSAANDPGHQFHKYPTDYTLFCIGTFDPGNGQLTGSNPMSLGVAVTFINQQPHATLDDERVNVKNLRDSVPIQYPEEQE